MRFSRLDRWRSWLTTRAETETEPVTRALPAQWPRWVVLDIETSGLDPKNERILSIAGVAIKGNEVIANDSFEGLIRQPKPSSHDNILIHGISGSSQLAGQTESQVLQEFEQWRAGAPVLGWHIGFDLSFLLPAYRRHGLLNAKLDSVDLAPLCKVLCGQASNDLDDWLTRFAIPIHSRHSAAADAWMTALLATALHTKADEQGSSDFQSLQRLGRAARWVG